MAAMKRMHPIRLGLVVAVLVVAAWSVDQPATAQAPAADSAVVVVSIDGLPASALNDPQLPMPTLRALIASGASAGSMTGVNPAVTWPTHTTFVTGVLPAQHGVVFNGLLMREP